jgi:hypothetical protein
MSVEHPESVGEVDCDPAAHAVASIGPVNSEAWRDRRTGRW